MTGDGFGLELALIALLILLNGFFAGAEIAVISARPARIRPRAESGDRRAVALLRLKADPDRFLATVQIGVTVVGTLASAVGGVAAIERLEPFVAAIPVPWLKAAAEPVAVFSVVLILSYASLVIGELVPKSLAVRHAEPLALVVARPIEWLGRTTRAVVALLTVSTGAVLRLIGQRAEAHNPFHTLDDLKALVREAEQQGLVEGAMVRGVLDIQDCEVRVVMSPRSRVVGIPSGATLVEALQVARSSGYSRLPVHAGDLDRAQGIVLAREMYEAALLDPATPFATLVRPALIVQETRSVAALLAEMRQAQRHMAFVVDERGVFLGLVTLEDLIEVILGDIEDESDAPNVRVRVAGPGVLIVDASIAVRELNQKHDLQLPESNDYVTLAGLVLVRHGTIPQGGEQIAVAPYRLTVLRVVGRRIERVRVEMTEPRQPVATAVT